MTHWIFLLLVLAVAILIGGMAALLLKCNRDLLEEELDMHYASI